MIVKRLMFKNDEIYTQFCRYSFKIADIFFFFFLRNISDDQGSKHSKTVYECILLIQ